MAIRSLFPGKIGIWKYLFLRREENWRTRKKPSGQGQGKQQTQPRHMASIPVASIHFNLQDMRNEDVSDCTEIRFLWLEKIEVKLCFRSQNLLQSAGLKKPVILTNRVR